MNRAFLLASIAAPFVLGCSIPLADGSSRPNMNSCTKDTDCELGARCIDANNDGNRTCVSGSSGLSNLIFEVRPAAGSAFGSDQTFILQPDQGLKVDAAQGAAGFPVKLPPMVELMPGQVAFDYDVAACGSTLTADVELAQTWTSRGLVTKTYNSTPATMPVADVMGHPAVFGFQATLPPGLYDIYVQPKMPDPPPQGCHLPPPLFLEQQAITADKGFAFVVDKPLLAKGTIQVPMKTSFDKWTLELLDPNDGKVISNPQLVDQSGTVFSITVQLEFYYFGKVPILRLRPPDGQASPSVYWDLSVGNLDTQKMEVDFALQADDLDINARPAQGGVEDEHGVGVPATIQIRSTSLSGTNQSNAAYTTSLTTDNGDFSTDLPPGTYDVVAVPNDNIHAITRDTWIVNQDPSCFCGHTLTAHALGILSGSVVGAKGDPQPGTPVQATPSIQKAVSYFVSRVGPQDVAPRQENGVTGATGAFQLGVDPGLYDVSARPLATSGFPWRVFPNLRVNGDKGIVMSSDVGSLQIETPVFVNGVVVDPNGDAIPQASISAWLPVADTGAAIQIGEAITDAQGSYTLPLPPSTTK